MAIESVDLPKHCKLSLLRKRLPDGILYKFAPDNCHEWPGLHFSPPHGLVFKHFLLKSPRPPDGPHAQGA